MSSPDGSREAEHFLDLTAMATPDPWDRVAPGYTKFIADALGLYAEDALRLARVSEGERVLDVATGPGTLARKAARITRVDALDFSPKMLDELQSRASPEEMQRLSLHCGDGQRLPFADELFDVAFSMFGLFLFPDRARALAELARVLRPGGRAVIGSWQRQDQVPALAAVSNEIRAMMPAEVGAPAAPLSDPSSIEAEMAAAGFEVEVHAVTHQIEAESLDVLWHGLRKSHVALVIAEAQLKGPRFEVLLKSIRARLERDLGPGPQQVIMPAWLGLGRLPD